MLHVKALFTYDITSIDCFVSIAMYRIHAYTSCFAFASSIAIFFIQQKLTKKPLNHKRNSKHSDRLYLLASNYSRFCGLPCYVRRYTTCFTCFFCSSSLIISCKKIHACKNVVVILDAFKQVGETRICQMARTC